jgi:hypothetical protein
MSFRPTHAGFKCDSFTGVVCDHRCPDALTYGLKRFVCDHKHRKVPRYGHGWAVCEHKRTNGTGELIVARPAKRSKQI